MPNWFNRALDTAKKVRYRAVIPVDIWITSKGDPVADQETAYEKIKEILRSGSQTVMTEGFNELLQLSDVKKYSDIVPF